MDSERFDRLVRSVGQTQSRRGVLKGLGKGLGAAALGTIGLSRLEAADAKGRKCPPPSGTYTQSCDVTETCSTAGVKTLSGTCDGGTDEVTGATIKVPTEIIVNTCKPQRYVISNCGGTLTCGSC